MFEQLKEFIGSGFFKTGSSNIMRLIVADKQRIIRLTELMNGSLRTNKIITFHKLIDRLNSNNSLNILKLPINDSTLDNNAWLVGFTEADRYLGVFIKEFKLKSEIRKNLRVEV